MAKQKTDRELAKLALPDVLDLIEQKRLELEELERIQRVRLKAIRRAMRNGKQFFARDFVTEPEAFRERTYYHPTSEGIEWSGKARAPLWFVEALLDGETVENLAEPKFVRPVRLGKPVEMTPTAKVLLDGAYDAILRDAQVKPHARNGAKASAGKPKR